MVFDLGCLLRTFIGDVSASPEAFAFPEDGSISYQDFARQYAAYSLTRKWVPRDSAAADLASLDAFASANNRCKDWQETPVNVYDPRILPVMKEVFDDFLHPRGAPLISSYHEIASNGRPGPGVNHGAKGTSYYTKYFCSRLTCTTPFLYAMYKGAIEEFPYLASADSVREAQKGNYSVVKGSKCCFVPKTSRTSRMVCIEPSVNMYLQLGVNAMLERRLRSFFGIDLSLQPTINRQLAREGSLEWDRENPFCTIDLSSASDSISLKLCETVLPPWFFRTLLELRSSSVEIESRRVPLYMLSTMGNGFTFSFQTVLFSVILRTCQILYGNCKGGRNWAAFGDDLIVKREIFDRVIDVLKLLGFIPNPEKTFHKGPFRESCGADWLYGQPVRPVFIRKLDNPQDYLVAVNLLNEWSAYTGVSCPDTCQLLLSQVPKRFRVEVPFFESSDSGLRVPSSFRSWHRSDKNGSQLYRKIVKRPSYIRFNDRTGSIHASRKLGKILYNPDGLYCSFLYGELRNLKIATRHSSSSLDLKQGLTPYWDYCPQGYYTNGVLVSWQRWETSVYINLYKPPM